MQRSKIPARTPGAMGETVAEGCGETEFHALACPTCGAALRFFCRPDLQAFQVRCSKTPDHVCVHRYPPASRSWWRNRTSDQWAWL